MAEVRRARVSATPICTKLCRHCTKRRAIRSSASSGVGTCSTHARPRSEPDDDEVQRQRDLDSVPEAPPTPTSAGRADDQPVAQLARPCRDRDLYLSRSGRSTILAREDPDRRPRRERVPRQALDHAAEPAGDLRHRRRRGRRRCPPPRQLGDADRRPRRTERDVPWTRGAHPALPQRRTTLTSLSGYHYLDVYRRCGPGRSARPARAARAHRAGRLDAVAHAAVDRQDELVRVALEEAVLAAGHSAIRNWKPGYTTRSPSGRRPSTASSSATPTSSSARSTAAARPRRRAGGRRARGARAARAGRAERPRPRRR